MLCMSIHYKYKHVFEAHVLLGIYFSNNINIYSSLGVTDQF